MKNNLQNKYIIDQHNPIHFVKRFIIKNEVEQLSKINQIKEIGDLGCGYGIISNELRQFGDIDGYDVNKETISLARQKYPDINFYNKDILKMEKKNYYNLIILSEVLQYVKIEDLVLKKISRLLKEKGYLILTVPINKNLITDFDKREKSKRYDPKQICNLLENNGFKIIKKHFWGYPLLKLFYSLVYIPRSNYESQKKIRSYSYSNFSLLAMKLIKYLFLFDLFFNNKNSFGLYVIAQKKS